MCFRLGLHTRARSNEKANERGEVGCWVLGLSVGCKCVGCVVMDGWMAETMIIAIVAGLLSK